MNSLTIKDLQVTYHSASSPAIKNINFAFENQQGFLLILGRSGSGKSTLAKVLSGVIPHIEGAEVKGFLEILGITPWEADPYTLSGTVTYVAQSPYDQMISDSVENEVKFTVENLEESSSINVAELLAKVGLLDFKDRKADELSGGQLQKLAIACALALNSKVIILDEPLAHLDPCSARELMNLLVELKQMGKLIILIEHRLREVVNYYMHIDHVLLLDQGSLIACFQGKELHKMVDLLIRAGIRVPVNLEAAYTLKITPKNPVDLTPLLYILKQLDWDSPFKETSQNPCDGECIKLNGVWAAYTANRYVLKDINLAFKKGFIYAIMGPNASGKTTLLKVMLGLLKPKRGTVKLLGRKVRSLKDSVGVVGYVPQNPDLILMFESVQRELEERALRSSYPGEVAELAEKLKVKELLNRNPHALSRGQRFRVALAATLALNPQILLLDEPTTGQDEECITALGEVLREFSENGGLAIVTTHDVDFALNYTDYCIVLLDGRVHAFGRTADILSSSEVLLKSNLAMPIILSACKKLKAPPLSECQLRSILQLHRGGST